MIAARLKEGWHVLRQLPFVAGLFCLYQIIWGLLLYVCVRTVVVPLLHRLPARDTAPADLQVFLAESQFRLVKTDDAIPLLTLLGLLLLARMLAAPFLNAGLYHVLAEHREEKESRLFFRGFRRHGVAFLGIHLLKWGLILLPAGLFLRFYGQTVWERFLTPDGHFPLLWTLAAFFLYAGFIRLLTMYLLIGRSRGDAFRHSLATLRRLLFPAAAVSLLLMFGFMLSYSMVGMLTMTTAGFLSLVLHFSGYGLRTVFKLWEIAAQFRCYASDPT